MKRLLAVSWEMPPMYGPRATQVSRTLEHLGERGWETTVVCLAPRRRGPHWRDGADAPPIPRVRHVRVPSVEESLPVRALFRVAPSLRGWPDDKRLWIRPASRAALAAARDDRPAGLLTFAQPWSDHLVGLRVKQAAALPWVAHFSDPWTDSPYFGGSAAQRRAAARLEADVIRHADAVVFVTAQTADLVMRKYSAAWRQKAHVVPHGFDPRQRPAAPPSGSGRLEIVYTGRFYEGLRTPLTLFRALAGLDRQGALGGRLHVRLIGPQIADFERDARALGVEGIVSFEPRQPPADALAAAARADVLLVVDAATPGTSVFLPSKLVDYLPLGKLILGLTPPEGATAALLRRLECPVAAPDDADAISSAVAQLLDRHARGTLNVSAAFAAVAADYDIRRTTASLDAILAATFGGARA